MKKRGEEKKKRKKKKEEERYEFLYGSMDFSMEVWVFMD